MIIPVAALMLLDGLNRALDSLPPPPPTNAERALWKYEGCLWNQTEAERGSAPLSAPRAKAVVARAMAACLAEKAEARRERLADSFAAREGGPATDPKLVEINLVSHLQKPKAADARN